MELNGRFFSLLFVFVLLWGVVYPLSLMFYDDTVGLYDWDRVNITNGWDIFDIGGCGQDYDNYWSAPNADSCNFDDSDNDPDLNGKVCLVSSSSFRLVSKNRKEDSIYTTSFASGPFLIQGYVEFGGNPPLTYDSCVVTLNYSTTPPSCNSKDNPLVATALYDKGIRFTVGVIRTGNKFECDFDGNTHIFVPTDLFYNEVDFSQPLYVYYGVAFVPSGGSLKYATHPFTYYPKDGVRIHNPFYFWHNNYGSSNIYISSYISGTYQSCSLTLHSSSSSAVQISTSPSSNGCHFLDVPLVLYRELSNVYVSGSVKWKPCSSCTLITFNPKAYVSSFPEPNYNVVDNGDGSTTFTLSIKSNHGPITDCTLDLLDLSSNSIYPFTNLKGSISSSGSVYTCTVSSVPTSLLGSNEYGYKKYRVRFHVKWKKKWFPITIGDFDVPSFPLSVWDSDGYTNFRYSLPSEHLNAFNPQCNLQLKHPTTNSLLNYFDFTRSPSTSGNYLVCEFLSVPTSLLYTYNLKDYKADVKLILLSNKQYKYTFSENRNVLCFPPTVHDGLLDFYITVDSYFNILDRCYEKFAACTSSDQYSCSFVSDEYLYISEQTSSSSCEFKELPIYQFAQLYEHYKYHTSILKIKLEKDRNVRWYNASICPFIVSSPPSGCSECEGFANKNFSRIFLSQEGELINVMLFEEDPHDLSNRNPLRNTPIIVKIKNKSDNNEEVCRIVTNSNGNAVINTSSKSDCAEYSFMYCCFYEGCNFKECLKGFGVKATYDKVEDVPSCSSDPSTDPPIVRNGKILLPTIKKIEVCENSSSFNSSQCLPLVLLLGIMLTVMFYAGKNPFAGFTIDSLRLGRHLKYQARGVRAGMKISAVQVVNQLRRVFSAYYVGKEKSKSDVKKEIINKLKKEGKEVDEKAVEVMAGKEIENRYGGFVGMVKLVGKGLYEMDRAQLKPLEVIVKSGKQIAKGDVKGALMALSGAKLVGKESATVQVEGKERPITMGSIPILFLILFPLSCIGAAISEMKKKKERGAFPFFKHFFKYLFGFNILSEAFLDLKAMLALVAVENRWRYEHSRGNNVSFREVLDAYNIKDFKLRSRMTMMHEAMQTSLPSTLGTFFLIPFAILFGSAGASAFADLLSKTTGIETPYHRRDINDLIRTIRKDLGEDVVVKLEVTTKDGKKKIIMGKISDKEIQEALKGGARFTKESYRAIIYTSIARLGAVNNPEGDAKRVKTFLSLLLEKVGKGKKMVLYAVGKGNYSEYLLKGYDVAKEEGMIKEITLTKDNVDEVASMLASGEFVLTQESTKEFSGLFSELRKINFSSKNWVNNLNDLVKKNSELFSSLMNVFISDLPEYSTPSNQPLLSLLSKIKEKINKKKKLNEEEALFFLTLMGKAENYLPPELGGVLSLNKPEDFTVEVSIDARWNRSMRWLLNKSGVVENVLQKHKDSLKDRGLDLEFKIAGSEKLSYLKDLTDVKIKIDNKDELLKDLSSSDKEEVKKILSQWEADGISKEEFERLSKLLGTRAVDFTANITLDSPAAKLLIGGASYVKAVSINGSEYIFDKEEIWKKLSESKDRELVKGFNDFLDDVFASPSEIFAKYKEEVINYLTKLKGDKNKLSNEELKILWHLGTGIEMHEDSFIIPPPQVEEFPSPLSTSQFISPSDVVSKALTTLNGFKAEKEQPLTIKVGIEEVVFGDTNPYIELTPHNKKVFESIQQKLSDYSQLFLLTSQNAREWSDVLQDKMAEIVEKYEITIGRRAKESYDAQQSKREKAIESLVVSNILASEDPKKYGKVLTNYLSERLFEKAVKKNDVSFFAEIVAKEASIEVIKNEEQPDRYILRVNGEEIEGLSNIRKYIEQQIAGVFKDSKKLPMLMGYIESFVNQELPKELKNESILISNPSRIDEKTLERAERIVAAANFLRSNKFLPSEEVSSKDNLPTAVINYMKQSKDSERIKYLLPENMRYDIEDGKLKVYYKNRVITDENKIKEIITNNINQTLKPVADNIFEFSFSHPEKINHLDSFKVLDIAMKTGSVGKVVENNIPKHSPSTPGFYVLLPDLISKYKSGEKSDLSDSMDKINEIFSQIKLHKVGSPIASHELFENYGVLVGSPKNLFNVENYPSQYREHVINERIELIKDYLTKEELKNLNEIKKDYLYWFDTYEKSLQAHREIEKRGSIDIFKLYRKERSDWEKRREKQQDLAKIVDVSAKAMASVQRTASNLQSKEEVRDELLKESAALSFLSFSTPSWIDTSRIGFTGLDLTLNARGKRKKGSYK